MTDTREATTTRYQGGAYWLDPDTGALLAAAVLADDSVDWTDVIEVDPAEFDAHEQWAEARHGVA